MNKLMRSIVTDKLQELGIPAFYCSAICKKASAALKDEGYLTTEETDGHHRSVITGNGTRAGISYEERTDLRSGDVYTAIVYDDDAQRLIADRVEDFRDQCDADFGGEYIPSRERTYARGTFNGDQISFKRKFSGHIFTNAEVERLLNGEDISISCQSSGGREITCTGHLQEAVGTLGNRFYRFVPSFSDDYMECAIN